MSEVRGTAADPWLDGRPPHLPKPPSVPAAWLLPGDPARVGTALSLLSDPVLVGQRREYRMGLGSFGGVPVGVCSTGIGGPSTEIAVVELARLGATTLVRIGGMGSFSAELRTGDLGIVARTTAESAAARFYTDGPAVADPGLVERLVAAAGAVGRTGRRITVSSVDGYYVGQGRPVAGFEEKAAARLREIRESGVDGVDMEAETVIGIGTALGLSCGAVLGVHGSRVTDTWDDDYESVQRDVVRTALRAITGHRND